MVVRSLLLLLPCLLLATPRPPSVFVSVLVRNKVHTLPYFLTQLYTQTYPKNRMVLHFRVDHSSDASLAVLDTWLEDIRPGREYHDIIRWGSGWLIFDHSYLGLYVEENIQLTPN